MAREFANVTGSARQDHILLSGQLPVAGLAACTFVLRGGFDSDTPDHGAILLATDAGTLNAVGLLRVETQSNMYCLWRNNDAGVTRFPFTFDGAMCSVICTYDGGAGTKAAAYVDGVSKTIMSQPTNTTLGTGHTISHFGARTGANGMNGRLAEAAIYNRVLSPGEIAMHAAGYSCKHFPRGLIFYAPLIREVHDIVGGLTGTITGTTVSAHPRIYA